MRRNALETVIIPLGLLFRGRRAGLDNSVRIAPELATDGVIELHSVAFANGGPMPVIHTAVSAGQDVSPPLAWSGVPDEAQQLVLIMEDIDVPLAVPSIHLLLLFPPTITSFADGDLNVHESFDTANSELRYIPNRHGRIGYGGPRPVPGHGPHRYGFHLYALDRPIPSDATITSVTDLLPLVAGHLLAAGFTEGTFRG